MFKILWLLLALSSVSAQNSLFFCDSNLEALPTQASGRVKPYYVLAHETIKYISGNSTINKLNATTVFCLLSVESLGLKSKLKLPLKVEHIQVRELLGLKENEEIMSAKALENKDLLKSEWMGQKENNSYKKELNKVLSRVTLYEQMIAGELWTLPEIMEDKVEWKSLPNFLTEARMQPYFQKDNREAFPIFFEQIKNDYQKTQGDRYQIELTYAKANFFTWAMLSVLAAIIAFVLSQKNTWGFSFVVVTLLLEITAITMRVFISGRAPITNMYETVMFSGFGALILSLIIYFIRRDRFFIIGGLAYNFLCLLMMKFANNMLDPSIQTLVPVLRDNFWLSTHVTTIILSYAALALSWMLANIVIITELKKRLTQNDRKYYVDLIYTCMKFGVVLLSAGVILGGVWADYSWGRFWGWDPKETWSLIVLLVYMSILHGKYTNWINHNNFVPLVAAAFLSVMMAWFGVNYILASGLHSYGFSEGGAIFLGSFFLAQISLLVIYLIKQKIKVAS